MSDAPDQGDSEWRVGWRIALACAVANGTGISLLFFCFSMFLIPMSADLGLNRADTGMVQSLIITAVLGAPLIGWLTDRLGFRPVFVACTLVLSLASLALGLAVSSLAGLAVMVAITGFLGSGSSAVTLTQPVNAHFRKYRGRALGLVGIGVSVTTMLVPPFLQQLMDAFTWRAGFVALAVLAGGVGLPLVLWLMPPLPRPARARSLAPGTRANWQFLRTRDFWLLSLANVAVAVASNGAISQMAPMIVEHGLSASVAAFGLSAFAAGQFLGKLGCGWLLDRFDPRLVAISMTLLPGAGFLIFLNADPGMALGVLCAAGLIGFLSGADVDIYAFFVARRFGLAAYGSAFGALHGLGWIGTASGIVLFSQIFHATGSYAQAQMIAIGLLGLTALLLAPVRLPPLSKAEPENPHPLPQETFA